MSKQYAMKHIEATVTVAAAGIMQKQRPYKGQTLAWAFPRMHSEEGDATEGRHEALLENFNGPTDRQHLLPA